MGTEAETFLRDIAFKDDLIKTPSGDLDKIEGLPNLKEALFRCLVTVPGTILHRPGYGCGIQQFQGASTLLETKRKIAGIIKEQFENDIRVEKVTGVSINSNDEFPDKTEILVRVQPVGQTEQVLSFVPFGE